MNNLKMLRTIALALYGLLALLLLFETSWLAPPEDTSLYMVLAIKLLPLLVFLPGMIKGRSYSYALLCFVLLLYFTDGVVGGYAHASLPGTMQAILSALLFTVLMITIRAHGKARKTAQ